MSSWQYGDRTNFITSPQRINQPLVSPLDQPYQATAYRHMDHNMHQSRSIYQGRVLLSPSSLHDILSNQDLLSPSFTHRHRSSLDQFSRSIEQRNHNMMSPESELRGSYNYQIAKQHPYNRRIVARDRQNNFPPLDQFQLPRHENGEDFTRFSPNLHRADEFLIYHSCKDLPDLRHKINEGRVDVYSNYKNKKQLIDNLIRDKNNQNQRYEDRRKSDPYRRHQKHFQEHNRDKRRQYKRHHDKQCDHEQRKQRSSEKNNKNSRDGSSHSGRHSRSSSKSDELIVHIASAETSFHTLSEKQADRVVKKCHGNVINTSAKYVLDDKLDMHNATQPMTRSSNISQEIRKLSTGNSESAKINFENLLPLNDAVMHASAKAYEQKSNTDPNKNIDTEVNILSRAQIKKINAKEESFNLSAVKKSVTPILTCNECKEESTLVQKLDGDLSKTTSTKDDASNRVQNKKENTKKEKPFNQSSVKKSVDVIVTNNKSEVESSLEQNLVINLSKTTSTKDDASNGVQNKKENTKKEKPVNQSSVKKSVVGIVTNNKSEVESALEQNLVINLSKTTSTKDDASNGVQSKKENTKKEKPVNQSSVKKFVDGIVTNNKSEVESSLEQKLVINLRRNTSTKDDASNGVQSKKENTKKEKPVNQSSVKKSVDGIVTNNKSEVESTLEQKLVINLSRNTSTKDDASNGVQNKKQNTKKEKPVNQSSVKKSVDVIVTNNKSEVESTLEQNLVMDLSRNTSTKDDASNGVQNKKENTKKEKPVNQSSVKKSVDVIVTNNKSEVESTLEQNLVIDLSRNTSTKDDASNGVQNKKENTKKEKPVKQSSVKKSVAGIVTNNKSEVESTLQQNLVINLSRNTSTKDETSNGVQSKKENTKKEKPVNQSFVKKSVAGIVTNNESEVESTLKQNLVINLSRNTSFKDDASSRVQNKKENAKKEKPVNQSSVKKSVVGIVTNNESEVESTLKQNLVINLSRNTSTKDDASNGVQSKKENTKKEKPVNQSSVKKSVVGIVIHSECNDESTLEQKSCKTSNTKDDTSSGTVQNENEYTIKEKSVNQCAVEVSVIDNVANHKSKVGYTSAHNLTTDLISAKENTSYMMLSKVEKNISCEIKNKGLMTGNEISEQHVNPLTSSSLNDKTVLHIKCDKTKCPEEAENRKTVLKDCETAYQLNFNTKESINIANVNIAGANQQFSVETTKKHSVANCDKIIKHRDVTSTLEVGEFLTKNSNLQNSNSADTMSSVHISATVHETCDSVGSHGVSKGGDKHNLSLVRSYSVDSLSPSHESSSLFGINKLKSSYVRAQVKKFHRKIEKLDNDGSKGAEIARLKKQLGRTLRKILEMKKDRDCEDIKATGVTTKKRKYPYYDKNDKCHESYSKRRPATDDVRDHQKNLATRTPQRTLKTKELFVSPSQNASGIPDCNLDTVPSTFERAASLHHLKKNILSLSTEISNRSRFNVSSVVESSLEPASKFAVQAFDGNNSANEIIEQTEVRCKEARKAEPPSSTLSNSRLIEEMKEIAYRNDSEGCHQQAYDRENTNVTYEDVVKNTPSGGSDQSVISVFSTVSTKSTEERDEKIKVKQQRRRARHERRSSQQEASRKKTYRKHNSVCTQAIKQYNAERKMKRLEKEQENFINVNVIQSSTVYVPDSFQPHKENVEPNLKFNTAKVNDENIRKHISKTNTSRRREGDKSDEIHLDDIDFTKDSLICKTFKVRETVVDAEDERNAASENRLTDHVTNSSECMKFPSCVKVSTSTSVPIQSISKNESFRRKEKSFNLHSTKQLSSELQTTTQLLQTFTNDALNITRTVKVLISKRPHLDEDLTEACKEILTEMSISVKKKMKTSK